MVDKAKNGRAWERICQPAPADRQLPDSKESDQLFKLVAFLSFTPHQSAAPPASPPRGSLIFASRTGTAPSPTEGKGDREERAVDEVVGIIDLT